MTHLSENPMAEALADADYFLAGSIAADEINRLEAKITHLRQDKAELLESARWALNLLATLNAHKNHPGIVSNALNLHGIDLWEMHQAAITKAGKES